MNQASELELGRKLLIQLDPADPDYLAADAVVAMDELHGLFGRRAYRVALRILRHPRDAEEVVQDVLFEVWRGRKRYHPSRGDAFMWLGVVVRNRAIDLLRKRNALAAVRASPVKMPERENPTPEECATAAQNRSRLLVAFDGLPENQRCTLELGYFQGCTQSEIASRIGAPLGTVKSRGRAGLFSLARAMSAA